MRRRAGEIAAQIKDGDTAEGTRRCGGSYGVVTRLTLRTHELAEYFGGVFTTIRAASDAMFRRLIGQFVEFYAENLLNPHWGDIVTFQRDNNLVVRMTFQGLDRQQAQAVWQPFLGGVVASGSEFTFTMAPRIFEILKPFWPSATTKSAG
jgi:hypothetical protein